MELRQFAYTSENMEGTNQRLLFSLPLKLCSHFSHTDHSTEDLTAPFNYPAITIFHFARYYIWVHTKTHPHKDGSHTKVFLFKISSFIIAIFLLIYFWGGNST